MVSHFTSTGPMTMRIDLRVKCVAQDEAKSGNDSERRRSGDSWSNLNSSSIDAALSDWFGDSDKSNDSGRKIGIAEILGIGLTGVLLVAGITSAAISIGKRSSSRSMPPEMKPITEQQERLLTSEEEVYWEEENIDDGKSNVQDESNLQIGQNLESNAGRESDLSSSSGATKSVSQRALVDDTSVESLNIIEESTFIGLDDSAKEPLQTASTLSDVISPDTNLTSPDMVAYLEK